MQRLDVIELLEIKAVALYLNEFRNHAEALEELRTFSPAGQTDPRVQLLRARALEMAVTWWQGALQRAQAITQSWPCHPIGQLYEAYCRRGLQRALAEALADR